MVVSFPRKRESRLVPLCWYLSFLDARLRGYDGNDPLKIMRTEY